MRFILSLIFIITIFIIGNFIVDTIKTSRDIVCDNKSNNNASYPIPNKALEEELSSWVKRYDEVWDMYTQCNKDLAKIAEECNYDVICTDQICELPK